MPLKYEWAHLEHFIIQKPTRVYGKHNYIPTLFVLIKFLYLYFSYHPFTILFVFKRPLHSNLYNYNSLIILLGIKISFNFKF